MWSARPEVQRVDEVLMNLQVGERHPDHNIITGRRWDHRTDLQAFLRFMILATLDHAVAHADVRLDVLGMALVCFQFFSQGSHKDPQGGQLRGGAVGRAAPDLTDDVVVGQHFASAECRALWQPRIDESPRR